MSKHLHLAGAGDILDCEDELVNNSSDIKAGFLFLLFPSEYEVLCV